MTDWCSTNLLLYQTSGNCCCFTFDTLVTNPLSVCLLMIDNKILFSFFFTFCSGRFSPYIHYSAWKYLSLYIILLTVWKKVVLKMSTNEYTVKGPTCTLVLLARKIVSIFKVFTHFENLEFRIFTLRPGKSIELCKYDLKTWNLG